MVYETELRHHGIKGQRWGVRRYQNPDGSLTPRGRKRWAKLQKKYPWLKDHEYSKNSEINSRSKNTRKKRISEMSDDELIKYTNTLSLQTKAIKARKELASETTKPKKESIIKSTLGDIGKSVVKEAANIGSKYLTDTLKKKMGIKPSEMEQLKEEAEKAGYLKSIFGAEEQKYKAKRMKQQYEKLKEADKKPEEDTRSAFQKAVDAANEMAKNSTTIPIKPGDLYTVSGYKPKVGESFKNNKKESYSKSYDGSSFGFSINSDTAKTVASAARPIVNSLLTEFSSGTKQGILVGSPYSSSYKSYGSEAIDDIFNRYMDKNSPKSLGSGSKR